MHRETPGERDASHAHKPKVLHAAAGSRPTAGRNRRNDPIRGSSRRLRHLSNSSYRVTPTGMYSGDSTIRKRKIGKNIGFLAFSAKRTVRLLLFRELVAE